MKRVPVSILLWISIIWASIQFNNSTYSILQLDKCQSFYNHTKRIIDTHPKSIIQCEGRVIIPQNNTQDDEITYHDMTINTIDIVDEQEMYPISGCLKLPGSSSSGQLEINYQNSWDITQHYSPTYNIPGTILNGTFNTGLKLLYSTNYGTRLNFQGSHTCFSNGTGLQLFIEPTIYRGDITIEQARFLRRKNQWVKDNWYSDNNIHFISSEVQPIIHCVTEDKYPLNCDLNRQLS